MLCLSRVSKMIFPESHTTSPTTLLQPFEEKGTIHLAVHLGINVYDTIYSISGYIHMLRFRFKNGRRTSQEFHFAVDTSRLCHRAK